MTSASAPIKEFGSNTSTDAIPPKWPYRRTRYFAHNELSRLTQDVLRTASGPLTTPAIAAAGDAAFKDIVAERALTVLRRLAKRGAGVKHGTSRNAKWALNVHAF